MAADIRILVIDDDPSLLAVVENGLQLESVGRVRAELRGVDGLAAMDKEPFDLIVTDYSLEDPQINGLTILQAATALPKVPLVVVMTAFASLELTLRSIQLGAYDFLTKPFQLEELRLVVRNAARLIELRRENDKLHAQVGELRRALERIDGDHRELVRRLDQMCDDTPTGATAESMVSPAAFQALELRRRRMRDQIAVYARMGHEIGTQLLAERSRLEQLYGSAPASETKPAASRPAARD